MNDEQPPQFDPATLGRSIGEAAAPFIYDAVKRALEDWQREQRSAQPVAQIPTPPWTGGPPTTEQITLIQKKASSDDFTRIAADVSDIKAAVQQLAAGTPES